jgi:4'-phosphopantetheinyl transferase
MGLVAVALDREIGVDIERVRPDQMEESVARRYFSPREVAALQALDADARQEAFFACWTRKEAYLKARGDGLSFPLDQFDVSLAPEAPAALLSVRGDPEEASRWSLQDLRPGPGYVAALAVAGNLERLKCWQFH